MKEENFWKKGKESKEVLKYMKLVVFSDIHFLDRKYEGFGNRKLTEFAIPLLDNLINRVNNEIRPDVFLYCVGKS